VAITVRPLEPRDAASCDAIVTTLPYHFGNAAGRAQCADAVRSQRGFVVDDDGDVVGFLTFEPQFDDAMEITWMAVRADRRREGLGRTLVDRVADQSSEEGRRLLIVLTVSPTDGPDEVENGYDATRAFYRANGFALTRDFPGHWDEDTPVLLTRVLSPPPPGATAGIAG
jgi:ribosomal protein S18 acetylase RimI-like enzyme